MSAKPVAVTVVVAGAAALLVACGARMPSVGRMPMPQMPEMPDEDEIRAQMERAMGKPDLPEEPDARGVQVVFQTGHAGAITAVGLSPDGRYVVSSGADETAKLWDIASGQEVRTFTGVPQFVRTTTFAGDASRIVIAGQLGGTLLDIATGRKLPTLEDMGAMAAVSSGGRYAARTAGVAFSVARRAKAQTGIDVVELATDRVVATLPTGALHAPFAVSDDGRIALLRRTEIDDRRMVAAAREGKALMPKTVIEVWDVATRKRRHDLPGLTDDGMSAASLSPDGATLVVGGLDRKIEIYDIATATRRQSLQAAGVQPWSTTNTLLFSRDGSMLAQASQDGHARVWRMPEGQLVTEFEATAVNFSADGRQLVAARAVGGAPFVRELATGTERSLAGGASAISELALIDGGRSVVAATETAGARYWNLATGELLRTFECPGGASAYSVSVSSSARWLATGCIDGGAYVWNLDTGARIRTLLDSRPEEFGLPAVVRFDRAGRRLAVGREDKVIVWEVAENREIGRLELPDSPLPRYMDPERMYEATEGVSEAQRKMAEDIASHPMAQRATKALRTFEWHPDGERVAVAKGGTLSLWEVRSGIRVREYSFAAAKSLEPPQQAQAPDAGRLGQLGNMPQLSARDRKMIEKLMGQSAGGAMPGAILQPGRDEEDILEASGLLTEDTRYIAFNADGRQLHTLGATGPTIWEVDTGRRIRVQKAQTVDPFDPMSMMRNLQERETGMGRGLTVSPDGRYGARGLGRIVKVWNLATGEIVAELLGHTSDVTSLEYLRDSGTLVSGGADGTVRLWNLAAPARPRTADGVQQLRETVQLIALGASDYVTVTPDQFYRISRRGVGGVAFRVDGKLYPFEQFDLRFNRPDVILERLGHTPADVVQGYRAAWQRRLKKLGFTEDRLGSEFHLPRIELVGGAPPVSVADPSLALRVRATDDRFALDRVNVFVNDVPVFGTAGLPIAERAAQAHERDIRVPLVAGRNKVQVSVLNQQGTESLRQTLYTTSTAPAAIPDVYVLAIGVSRYQRESYSLRFASKDASDLIGAYRALAGQADAVGNVHVLPLTDDKATRTSIREARRWLEQARVNDLVVLFAAGHGMTDARSNYYFGTYDIDPEQPGNAGLPYEEFEALLDGIPAMQKLMLIDTCFSGEIEKDEPVAIAQQADTGGAGTVQMRAFKASRAINVVADSGGAPAAMATDALRIQQELFADLRRGTGAVVISSASGNEYALEGEQWANGVFTYALLDGLKNGRADRNQDQVISVSELQAHVLDEVRRLTAGGQNPTVRRENLEYDFRVY